MCTYWKIIPASQTVRLSGFIFLYDTPKLEQTSYNHQEGQSQSLGVMTPYCTGGLLFRTQFQLSFIQKVLFNWFLVCVTA